MHKIFEKKMKYFGVFIFEPLGLTQKELERLKAWHENAFVK